MNASKYKGFSLVEVMVVVSVVGILALMSIPGIRQGRETAEAIKTANDIRVFINAIDFYSAETGSYPDAMAHQSVPPKIGEYLPSVWTNGTYNWFYDKRDSFTYVYFYNLKFTAEQATKVDSIIDDGNISTGRVRSGLGTGLIYLFEGG